jgi:hypothetical protein
LYDLTPEQVMTVKQLSQEQVQYIKGSCTGYIYYGLKEGREAWILALGELGYSTDHLKEHYA